MRIFFFTTCFAPSVGGIEKVAAILCDQFVDQGHEVRLATLTPGNGADRFSYPVIRRPGFKEFRRLLDWCDVHVQANVSLKYVWPRVFWPGRFVYQHNNVYQRDDGELSFRDHLKRLVASRTRGIANSHYTAAKLDCRYTVLNPYDDTTFRTTLPWDERRGDLVFLGRLVSQKGCDTLIESLGHLRRQGAAPALVVIGEGPDRPKLEDLAERLGVAGQVHFAGALQGQELAEELNCHRVFIAPSRYEEPFGIVALEALACGCLPVVSARGGLVDAIGPHGFTSPNGDSAALAERLAEVLADLPAARRRLEGVEAHLAAHRAPAVAKRYLEIFSEVLTSR